MKYMFAMLAAILLAGIAQAATLDADTRDFLRNTAAGGIGEVEISQFAVEHSDNPEVRRHAKHMVDDHTKINTDLKDLAASLNVELPTVMKQEQKDLLDRLGKMNGVRFDREFTSAMIDCHKRGIDAFESKGAKAADLDVKAFAEKYLPVLKDHLAMLRDLQKSMPRGTFLEPGFERSESVSYDRPAFSHEVIYTNGMECNPCPTQCDPCNSCCNNWPEPLYENDWRVGTATWVHEPGTEPGTEDNCDVCD